MATRKRRVVRVGDIPVPVVIYTQVDVGSPDDQDEWGRAWTCEYDGDNMAIGNVAGWLQGTGIGASEGEAVRAFIANCHRRADSE